MLAFLLLLLLFWAFVKLGVGTVKIVIFLLVCGFAFIFFVHLLIPLILFGGLLFIIFAGIRH